jgi:hypothetical protein
MGASADRFTVKVYHASVYGRTQHFHVIP